MGLQVEFTGLLAVCDQKLSNQGLTTLPQTMDVQHFFFVESGNQHVHAPLLFLAIAHSCYSAAIRGLSKLWILSYPMNPMITLLILL